MPMRKKGEPPNQSKAAKKRQYAKRTPQARANQKRTQAYSRPGKITQAGVGNIPVTVARAAMEIAKFASKNKSSAKPKSKASRPKPMSASQYQKETVSTRAANKSYRDRQVRDQQRKVDERRARAVKDQKSADAIKRKARQQGVARASGGSKPKGMRKYN